MPLINRVVQSFAFVLVLATLADADAISNAPQQWTLWLTSTGASLPGTLPSAASSGGSDQTGAGLPASPGPSTITGGGTSASSLPTSASGYFSPTAAGNPAPADAFVNFGSGPYPDVGLITTGGALPWYDSPQVANLFGGPPSTQQQADFSSTVLQRVEQTFQLAGVPVNLTSDPSAVAAHTLSLVANTGSQSMPDAIGMTNIGGSGFSFIDPIAKSAQSVDQLEWIVAHNISHELMLAFGVPENYDKTGNFIDATNANWSMMTSPTATFSTGAAQALLARNFQDNSEWTNGQAAQLIDPQTVPEPGTLILWVLGAVISAACLRMHGGILRKAGQKA